MGGGDFAGGGGKLETRDKRQEASNHSFWPGRLFVGRISEAPSDKIRFRKYLQANTNAIVRNVK